MMSDGCQDCSHGHSIYGAAVSHGAIAATLQAILSTHTTQLRPQHKHSLPCYPEFFTLEHTTKRGQLLVPLMLLPLCVLPPCVCPPLCQVRLNGENPAKDFQPCPGILGEVVFPTHLDGVRVDSWVESGTEISPYYDSLLGKLMVYAPTREMAVAKIQQALAGGHGAESRLLYQPVAGLNKTLQAV